MRRPEIQLQLGRTDDENGTHGIAGERVITWPRLERLAPFRVEAEGLPERAPEPTGPGPDVPAKTTSGFLADREREVVCRTEGGAYRLEMEGLGEVVVGRTEAGVTVVATGEPADPEPVAAVLGPGLTLALALRGVWVLHASAVAREGGVLLFLGDQGAGKSTLARFLGEREGWDLLADDLVPVASGAEGLEARPRYPQPRWRPEEQRSVAHPEAMPVRGIFLLGRKLAEGVPAEGLMCRKASAASATLGLVAQTICASFFDDDLLEAHLDWATTTVVGVPVHELRYPLRWETLEEIEKTVWDRAG